MRGVMCEGSFLLGRFLFFFFEGNGGRGGVEGGMMKRGRVSACFFEVDFS